MRRANIVHVSMMIVLLAFPLLHVAGCSPSQSSVTALLFKAVTEGGCQGCEPMEGEEEGEMEGEGEGEPEGEVPAEGELLPEGETEGETSSEGEGESEGETVETVLLPGNVPLVMVWVPAGSFLMGRYPGEFFSYADEDPQHLVSHTSGFWMARTEITQAQWLAVMGTTPWADQNYAPSLPGSPASYISWNNAKAFINALNTHTGMTFRLPSEAEWEYAARAGTGTRFYWGDDSDYSVGDAYAWWTYNTWDVDEKYPHPVGQKLANVWGLFDMSGNVREWCEDDWHENYTGAPANGTAWVDAPRGPFRVQRGGSWRNYGYSCRSASRSYENPLTEDAEFGFRIVR